MTDVKVASSQRGSIVKGSVVIRYDGTDFSAVASAPTARRSGRKARLARVGRTARAAALAGKLNFAVKLDRATRVALRRKGKLRVTLTLRATPPGRRTAVIVRQVNLRR